MAPAEKFGASLPIDQRLAALRGFLHAGLQHLDRVAADGVHLRVELNGDHAVAEVDQARAGVLLDDAVLFLRRPQDLQVGRGRLDETSRKRASPPSSRLAMSGGTPPSMACVPCAAASTSLTPIASNSSNGPELPAESPPHHAIDVVDRMRDVGRDAGGVDQRRRQRRAQEFAGLVLAR